ncbi:hypothetical protein [Saccharopolyspora sp. SCSIO 74807]|uniref:acyl-CoA-like ligand-binding transcription factor n=1 Tax=Saccharopolyspora sp. SCSIO 74807 TaxID=3118084 RepID=UPI00387EB003
MVSGAFPRHRFTVRVDPGPLIVSQLHVRVPAAGRAPTPCFERHASHAVLVHILGWPVRCLSFRPALRCSVLVQVAGPGSNAAGEVVAEVRLDGGDPPYWTRSRRRGFWRWFRRRRRLLRWRLWRPCRCAALAAYERWLQEPGIDLCSVLDDALRHLAEGFSAV